jgi:2-iminobutanoate/2-iminopropanoate deaminase
MASEIDYSGTPGQGIGLPFSPVVGYDNLLFCSGQVGFLPGTNTLVAGGIEEQTRQTMENLRANLERAGGSLEQVVKVLVFLADAADFAAFNEVHASFFQAGLALGEHSPARSPRRGVRLLGAERAPRIADEVVAPKQSARGRRRGNLCRPIAELRRQPLPPGWQPGGICAIPVPPSVVGRSGIELTPSRPIPAR